MSTSNDEWHPVLLVLKKVLRMHPHWDFIDLRRVDECVNPSI